MTRIQWNIEGFQQLRRDPTLVRQIDDLAADIATRAGHGFESDSRTDPSRHRAIVYTGSARAMHVNARDNTLLKALGGG